VFNTPVADSRRRKYRFHLLGLVHLPVSEKYMGCAFTQKIVKMSKMLLSLGHEVIIYGAEGSDAPCTEFVQTHTLSDIRQEWGDGDNRFDIGYDWYTNGFRHDFNQARTPTTLKFYEAAGKYISKVKRPDDFLLLMQGKYHSPVAKMANLHLTCEPGIGYRGSYCNYRAFESAYLMNFTLGSRSPYESVDGAYYWRVIPNYFDAKDFQYQEKKDDYFFFIGRLIIRKGVLTAVKATEAIGAKLILAGQQSNEINVKTLPSHCEFIGYVGPEERSELMGKAKAVFVPTIYLEAFGGVNVEAQLCGTPAITTNFGVFPETVVHGKTGFRCDTLQDFVNAVKSVDDLDSKEIRQHSERYLMENVKWEFQKWWDDLYTVYESIGKPKGTTWGWNYLKSEHVDD
jgi:glycosyltransferase involved in cell wall biosynthesis